MDAYLTFGLGFYISACLFNLHTFKSAGFSSVVKGMVLGILLWPAVVAVFAVMFMMGQREKD